MITHIVLFQLDDKLAGEEKGLHLAALKSDFEQLPHTIKELVDLRIEINANPSEKYDPPSSLTVRICRSSTTTPPTPITSHW